MRVVLCLCAIVFYCAPALAYERPQAVSLNGEWDFQAVEPLIEIVPDRMIKPDFPQLSPEWHEVIDPKATPPWDGEWNPILVPSAWEHYTSLDYNGAGWYARFVDVPQLWCEPGKRIWLEFDAVATAAGVWINNQFVGAHIGDYSRWRVELTDFAVAGSILVAVYVDELPGHITQGFLSMIGPHHGGIWQDVRIYHTGPIAVEPDGVWIECDAQTGSIKASVSLKGIPASSSSPYGMRICLDYAPYEPGMSVEGPEVPWNRINQADFNSVVDRSSVVDGVVPAAALWSPQNPSLYILRIELNTRDTEDTSEFLRLSDCVYQRFGFREIEIDGSQLILGGEPLFIRSALNWGYYPNAVSPTPTPEQVREEFSYIKSLGFNAETVCLVNMPDYFYDLADEMGVLVWQEYPTWHNDFDGRHLATYRREFASFLARDRNHPSIILRSLSVEAGVDDWDVVSELYQLAKKMTDTPVQDNNSWFSHSDPELTDWYGEDYYLNCNQWARHFLEQLPTKLDNFPIKPYIIGESILANTWVDVDALMGFSLDRSPADAVAAQDDALAPYLGGASSWPYWFPLCFDSCQAISAQLRQRYNPVLDGQDIIKDYFLPQSQAYALGFRRFQIELLQADPRYAGYTVNVVRDMPLIRAGLMNSLGRPRWSAEEWNWHGDQTTVPVTTSELPTDTAVEEAAMEYLTRWKPEWEAETDRSTPVLVMREGYEDLEPLFTDWLDVRYVDDHQLSPAVALTHPTYNRMVLVTSVLTRNCVWHLQQGGAVVLLTSKWPGALGSYHHYFWRDAVFVPPFGPWSVADCERILDLHYYDLNLHRSEVIPVDDLGLTDKVDPLLRLYDTHDRSSVITHDQVFATNVSDGLLIASSLDHTTPAGQWVLAKLVSWANHQVTDLETALASLEDADKPRTGFPVTSISPAELHEFAVSRPNSIISLDEDWQFKLDPKQAGEAEGWMKAERLGDFWDTARTGISWEALGHDYDGMAWYRRWVEIPADWAGASVRLVAEGVDDAYVVWLNGSKVTSHGSFTVHEESVWLKQTTTDLTDYIRPGESNLLVLQVVDIVGQGGVWKPLYLAME